MAAFVTELWESIFTPGPTTSLLRAANGSFAALQLVLAALLVATASVHFVVLSLLCAGLWWSVNWFAAELALAQQQQQQEAQQQGQTRKQPDADDRTPARRRRPPHDADASSDTEVEAVIATGPAAAPELRHRPLPAQPSPSGTQSSASTEDEWEKISSSGRDKVS